jgi:hypothetical protein
MKILFSVFFTWVFAFFVSCGVKGSPQIPPSKVPEPVKDVKIKQQGKKLVIYWIYKPIYEDGKPIKEKIFFKIEENDNFINSQINKSKNLYWFKRNITSFKKEFCYRIWVFTEKGYTAVSKYFCYLPSKQIPVIKTSLLISIKNEGILLKWNENYELLNIYRGKTEKNIPPIPYVSIKGKDTFIDKNVKLNNRYCYFITTEKDSIESDPSSTKCVVYRDIFPPDPVKNLEGIFYKGKLILIWTESPSEDVIGYVVEKNGKLLNNEPINTYFFIVDRYKKGDIISVYAVDKAGNKSSPAYLKVE